MPGKQGLARAFGILDAPDVDFVIGASEAAGQQKGVVLRVLDDEKGDRVAFVRRRLSHCVKGLVNPF